MLTPQEVSEHSFAKSNFGGYNMRMVDDFLDQLTEDYTSLYNENQVLKSKMKMLVDKIDEYRETEDIMRKTLLSAQRVADDLITEAEQKKKTMLDDAEAQAAGRLEELREMERQEEAKLEEIKNTTKNYVNTLKKELVKEAEFLKNLDSIPSQSTEKVVDTVSEIHSNLQQMMDAQESPAVEEPVQEEQPEEKPAPAYTADEETTREFSTDEIANAIHEAVEGAAQESAPQEAEEAEAEAPADETPDVQPAKAQASGETDFDLSGNLFGNLEKEEQEESELEEKLADASEPTIRMRINFDDLQFGENYHKD